MVSWIAVLGHLAALRLAWSLLWFLRGLLLSCGCCGSTDPKKLGEWAVVTGATDGIGKAVATQLAKRGVSVVLVSRTQSRLDDTAAEIKAACPSVATLTVQLDFSSAGAEDYARLGAALSGKDIGVLYNNVGISYNYAQFLEQLDAERVDAIIEMNMRAMVKVTQLVLPGMLEQKRGAIVNIGSAAGSIPDPLYSVYSGSKAFVEYFSASISASPNPLPRPAPAPPSPRLPVLLSLLAFFPAVSSQPFRPFRNG